MEGPLFEIDGESLKRMETLMARMGSIAMPKVGLNLQRGLRPGDLSTISNMVVLAAPPEAKESRFIRVVRGKTRVMNEQAEKYGIKFISLEMCDADMQERIDAAMADKRAELRRLTDAGN